MKLKLSENQTSNGIKITLFVLLVTMIILLFSRKKSVQLSF